MDKKKLAFALLFLAVGAVVALRGILSTLKDPAPPADVVYDVEDDGAVDDEVAAFDAPPNEEVEEGALTRDLVAQYGSLEPTGGVRDAFGLVDPADPLGSDPESPTGQPAPLTAWPRHHVSLVLLSGDRHSAVVDQTVVEVGDTVAAGRVLSIEAQGLRVESEDGGVLVYPLGPEAVDPTIEEAPDTQETGGEPELSNVQLDTPDAPAVAAGSETASDDR